MIEGVRGTRTLDGKPAKKYLEITNTFHEVANSYGFEFLKRQKKLDLPNAQGNELIMDCIDKIENEWIGFCQYRKFWSLEKIKSENLNIDNIKEKVLKKLPDEFEKYEAILANPQFVNQWKLMKFIKKGFKIFIKNPLLIFNKNKRNLNFHFDLMHGINNLNKAIDLLDDKNKNDFRKFVNTEVAFNPHIMIICKSKEKLKKYYEDLFPWLEKCEKLFGFENLKGYDYTRMYGFLSERFMSYWFQKNTKFTTMPVIFFDINNTVN